MIDAADRRYRDDTGSVPLDVRPAPIFNQREATEVNWDRVEDNWVQFTGNVLVIFISTLVLAACGSVGEDPPKPVTGQAAIGGGGEGAQEPVTGQAAMTTSSTTTTSPDYGGWNDSNGCLTPNDAPHKEKLGQLAQRLFRLATTPADGVGCVTEPYLANGYSKYFAGNENHAGVDFKAPRETPVYAIHGGTVENQTLNRSTDSSTLTIKSVVGDKTLEIIYLHCNSQIQKRKVNGQEQVLGQLQPGVSVLEGDEVCQTGDIGAPFGAHLHLEVKVKGMDKGSLFAVSPVRSQCNSSFSGYNADTEKYDKPTIGCSLDDIRTRTVDPIVL